MTYLVTGLALFFGVHFYSAFRSRLSDRDIKKRLGEGLYMGLYSAISAVGLALILFGYWSAPATPPIYTGPEWAGWLMLGAMAIACVLIVSAYWPANHIRCWARHPMILAITIWAGSHLLTPTNTKELLVFGSFLFFGIVDAVSSFCRMPTPQAGATLRNDMLTIAAGLGVYALIGLFLHQAVIGVRIW